MAEVPGRSVVWRDWEQKVQGVDGSRRFPRNPGAIFDGLGCEKSKPMGEQMSVEVGKPFDGACRRDRCVEVE
jgi:hypothetical protein